jgi:very-short-patch-repair endonuclease
MSITQIELLLRSANIEFINEYKFHSKRKWRFDIVLISYKIAIEYEGGTFKGGRHVRGKGYSRDCEKYNAAQKLGWIVLRYTIDMIRENPGQVQEDIQEIIRQQVKNNGGTK